MLSEKSAGDSTKSSAEHQLQYFYDHKISLLQKISSDFFSSSSFVIKIGFELEFYLLEQDSSQIFDVQISKNFIAELAQRIPQNSLIYQIEKEQGAGQIEVKTAFDADLLKVCCALEQIKLLAKNLATEKKLIASFAAQPFVDDCGSALQFNISLHDKDDHNIFNFDAQILEKTAAALLQKTNEMMIFLAPKQQDYSRFFTQINGDLFKKGKFTAPINLSFGADNRTCAIRIPHTKEKRLEYRIAASDADPFLSSSAILLAVLFGLKNDVEALKQVHGNAFDEQYRLPHFCKNLQEAEEKFWGGDYLRRILSTTLIGNKT